MKKLVVLAALLCSACGSFQLGYVRATQGQSRELMNTDMLYCKGEAEGAAHGGAQGVETRLIAATVIGAPIAHNMEVDNQRTAYRACMEGRGYEYLGTEKPQQQAAQTSNPYMPKSALFHAPD